MSQALPKRRGRRAPVMETLSSALERLARAGFCDSFQPRSDGLLALDAGRLYAPEQLGVEEVVRFEGESDPEDEAVLFALRSRDGAVRGTFVAPYGTAADPDSAEMMRRLEGPRKARGER